MNHACNLCRCTIFEKIELVDAEFGIHVDAKRCLNCGYIVLLDNEIDWSSENSKSLLQPTIMEHNRQVLFNRQFKED